jgi:hypothetical protein
MKLIEFKAELITRWYEIAPFSEISICEDDRYGGLLKIHIEWICRGTVRCYDTLLSYSELSDAKYNAMDTILNTLTGAYYSTLILKNKEKL